MAEEPENVLEHHWITAAGGIEEAGTEIVIGQQHGHGTGQYRHHRNQQIGSNQPGPDEQRHFQQRHAGSAHVHDGHDHVDRTHDGRSAHQMHRKYSHRKCITGLQYQWRIQSPATGRRTTRNKQGENQQRKSKRQQPETEVVHAWQGHVRRTHLQGNHPVGQSCKSRHDGTEHHEQGMHGRHGIEKTGINKLHTGLEQLRTYDHGQCASGEEHRQTENQVHRTDVFMIGGKEPAAPALHGAMIIMACRVSIVCM